MGWRATRARREHEGRARNRGITALIRGVRRIGVRDCGGRTALHRRRRRRGTSRPQPAEYVAQAGGDLQAAGTGHQAGDEGHARRPARRTPGRSPPAKFAKALSIFSRPRCSEIAPHPAAGRRATLAQWFDIPAPGGIEPAADRRRAARRPSRRGPARTARFIQNGRPRQQRRPRLRLQLLQLQVVEIRIGECCGAPRSSGHGRASNSRRRCAARRCPPHRPRLLPAAAARRPSSAT